MRYKLLCIEIHNENTNYIMKELNEFFNYKNAEDFMYSTLMCIEKFFKDKNIKKQFLYLYFNNDKLYAVDSSCELSINVIVRKTDRILANDKNFSYKEINKRLILKIIKESMEII